MTSLLIPGNATASCDPFLVDQFGGLDTELLNRIAAPAVSVQLDDRWQEAGEPLHTLGYEVSRLWVGKDVVVHAVDQDGEPMRTRPYNDSAERNRWKFMDPNSAHEEIGRLRKNKIASNFFAPFEGILDYVTPNGERILLSNGASMWVTRYKTIDSPPTHLVRPML